MGEVYYKGIAPTTALVTPDNSVVSSRAEILKDFNITSPEAVTAWVSRQIEYKRDEKVWGEPDYWQTPEETLSMGTGDCEDVAILTVSLLRALGWSSKEAFVVTGVMTDGVGHAWVVAKEGSRWRIFEPTAKGAEEAKGLLKAGLFLKGLVLMAVDPVSGLLTMLGGQILVDEGAQFLWEMQRDSEFFVFNDEYFFEKEGLSFGFLGWSIYGIGEPQNYKTLQVFLSQKEGAILEMRVTNKSKYPVKTWVDIVVKRKKEYQFPETVKTKRYAIEMEGGGDSRHVLFDLGRLLSGTCFFEIKSNFLTYAYPAENRPELIVY